MNTMNQAPRAAGDNDLPPREDVVRHLLGRALPPWTETELLGREFVQEGTFKQEDPDFDLPFIILSAIGEERARVFFADTEGADNPHLPNLIARLGRFMPDLPNTLEQKLYISPAAVRTAEFVVTGGYTPGLWFSVEVAAGTRTVRLSPQDEIGLAGAFDQFAVLGDRVGYPS